MFDDKNKIPEIEKMLIVEVKVRMKEIDRIDALIIKTKKELLREILQSHLSNKNFQLVHTKEVDFKNPENKLSPQQLAQTLGVDAVIVGEVIEYERTTTDGQEEVVSSRLHLKDKEFLDAMEFFGEDKKQDTKNKNQ